MEVVVVGTATPVLLTALERSKWMARVIQLDAEMVEMVEMNEKGEASRVKMEGNMCVNWERIDLAH